MAFATLPPGRRIGRFQILDVLGQGGMGVVYAAVEQGAARPVALKVLPPEVASEPSYLARFRREGEVAATINHPNVVNVLFHGNEDGLDVIALELVQGGSLKARLRSGPLRWPEAARFGVEIARGLGAIHSAGLVHRDLKPDNVLLDQHGHAKLADFGLVTAGRTASGRLTVTGELIGTAEYMAPEQSESARTVDGRADLYSLGAVLYALVVGRPPFEGTGYDLIKKHLVDRVRPPGELVAGLPEPFGALILRLLEKEPAGRPQTAEEVADELEEIIEAGEEKPGRSVGGVIAVALLLALGGAGAAFFAFRPRHAAPPSAPTQVRDVAARLEVDHAPRLEGPLRLLETRCHYEWRTAGPCRSVALLPDGKRAISADAGGGIRLWDLATGYELRTYACTPEDVVALAVSPDGKRVVTGQLGAGALLVFDVETGERLLELAGHDGGPISAVAWSGDRILSAGGPYDDVKRDESKLTYRLWNATTGALIHDMRPTSDVGVPGGLAFLGDRRAISCASGDRLVIWDLEKGVPADTIRKEGSSIVSRTTAVALTRDARHALVCSQYHCATLIDLETRTAEVVANFDETVEPVAAALDAEGALRVIGCDDGFRLLDATGRKSPWQPSVPCANACAISPDGRRLVTGHEDGFLRSWDVDARRELSKEAGIAGAVTLLDRKGTVAGCRYGRTFDVNDLARGRRPTHAENPGWMTSCAALSEDGSRLVYSRATGNKKTEIVLVDATTGQQMQTQVVDDLDIGWPVHDLAFSPDGSSIITCDLIGHVRVYRTEGLSRREEEEFRVQSGDRYASLIGVAFVEGTKGYVAADRGGEVYFGSFSGDMIRAAVAPSGDHKSRVTAVVGGRAFALTGDEKGIVKLWQRRLERDNVKHGAEITALALSPDEKLAATASKDGTIVLLDTATAKRVGTITLVARDHATALVLESATRLHVGTARGIVMTFELKR